MSFLNKILNKLNQPDPAQTIILKTNSQAESDALLAFGSEQSGLKIFKGVAEHAYESNFIAETDTCPRCHAPTELMYGNFIYATEIAPRLMTGPGGFFCTKCSTVIINDEQVAIVAEQRFQYGGVLGIETIPKKPDFFKTMNGKKCVYILDENKQFSGIASSVNQLDDIDYSPAFMLNNGFNNKQPLDKAAADKRKAKAKAAKKARKTNRK